MIHSFFLLYNDLSNKKICDNEIGNITSKCFFTCSTFEKINVRSYTMMNRLRSIHFFIEFL